MNRSIESRAAAYRKTRKKRKALRTTVTYLAAIVVFCTVYALILPAITKERAAFCGYEEHIHSEECYSISYPVCEICGNPFSPEDTSETQNSDIADTQEADTAEMQAVDETETETADTGQIEADSISEKAQTEDTVATETEAPPAVTEEVHIHKAANSSITSILICEKEEHIHIEQCFVDRNADIEDSLIWEETIPEELNGTWQTDLIEVAKSQLGYTESKTNFETDENGSTKGYTRYGAWDNDPYTDWKNAFVRFCMHYAGYDSEYFPVSDDTEEWIKLLEEKGLFGTIGDLTFKEGDIVFIKISDTEYFPAILTEILTYTETDETTNEEKEETLLKVIEGDCDGSVAYKEYKLSSLEVYGFADTRKAYLEYRKHVPFEKVFEDENVTVTARYYLTAGIPDDAVLTVTPIEEGDKQYEDCYAEAIDEINKNTAETRTSTVTDFRLYDISFILDGEEITPLDNVDIQISYPSEIKEDNEVSVIHYAEDGPELSKVSDFYVDEGGNLNTEFETDSFSLFAIVTTDSLPNYIVSFQKYSITDDNIAQLGNQTFAVTQEANALYCEEDGLLSTRKVNIRTSGNVSGAENLIQWTFERNGTTGSRYYLKAAFDDTVYYLAVSNGALVTVTDKDEATVFTATRKDTNLTLASGTSYINVTDDGPTVSTTVNLTLYNAPSGSGVKVVFDGQLGNPTYMTSPNHKKTYYKWRDNERLEVTADANGYVTLPKTLTTGSSYYPMRINGWYDIINGVYYNSKMLDKQIKVTSDTIFYPEWVAESYDIGQNIDTVTNQPDTSDFITTNVFDYNELFNVHSCYYNESNDSWYFDENSELGFIFFDYLQPTGNIGYMYDKDNYVNGVSVNVENTPGNRGSKIIFPGQITEGIATAERIEALFGERELVGKLSLGEGDWLYSYDEDTGFYYYNSAKNAASYNQELERFYVYDYTVNIDGSSSINDFVPLNYIDNHGTGHVNSPQDTTTTDNTVYCEKGNQVNYWFGMSSQIEFYLPEDSGSGKNISGHGEDMQFRFSGDDDVWVFINNDLVLDLGGVHDVVYGEINFSTGVVKTGQAFSPSESDIAKNTAANFAGMPGVEEGTPSGVTITQLPTLNGGEKHTLTVYYLERGSSLSNCAIYFNLSPAYELEITKSDKNGNIHLANAHFQIFDDPECTNYATLYRQLENGALEDVTGQTFITDENGVLNCYGLLDGKKYYIKEVLPPSGYPDMSKFVIEVDLSSDDKETEVVIDSNKNPWIYAKANVVSSDTKHKIELEVYNDVYIGGNETTSVYAEKVWEGESTDLPGSITVLLYANGVSTSRTLTLNSENDWKGYFYELPLRDSDGNIIEYTVEEIDLPYGYTPSYDETFSQISTTVDIPGHFKSVASLTDGKYYRFVSTSTGQAIQGSSGSSISGAVINEENDAQLWKAIASSTNGCFLLQNKAYTSRYLSLASTSWGGSGASTTNSTTSNSAKISLDAGKLKSNSGYYLTNGSNNSFSTSSRVANGATITAYEWVDPSTTTETIDIPGWKITNTAWGRLTIPVEKIWDETVPASERAPVEFELYLVRNGTENTPQRVASVTVTAETDWKALFEDLEYPGEDGYYCIVERSEIYTVTHSGETVYILIGDTLCEASVVNIDENGNTAGVQITNSMLYLLPDTGGTGKLIFAALGLILVVSSGILLAYQYRVKRKEDF